MNTYEFSEIDIMRIVHYIKVKELEAKLKKYNTINNKRKISLRKYHYSDVGRQKRREASQRYYKRKKQKLKSQESV